MARRDADKSDASRRPSANPTTSETTPKSNKPKRRHSSGHRRSSIGLDIDKENQFTSTPIKSFEDHHFDALRDVSNLTPNRRLLSTKKCRRSASPSSHRKHKKKKLCLNPSHRKEFDNSGKNYFRPFETVDSHIEGVLLEGDNVGVKRRIEDTYAPTLPTFAMEYSPCFMRNTHCLYAKATPLGKYLAQDQDTPHPNKKAKIDHVSDFLHQINFITSPEDDKLTCPTMESKSALKLREEAKVSPLVKKFVDLRFSQLSLDNCKNNSSLINDLSLDQIVDAIFNSSVESDNKNTTTRKENESNETQEENLINTENERHVGNSFDRCSSDSGFKSSTTEYSHQLEGNFHCKCNKTSTPLCDKTIININETFNERCVDVIKPRKRPSTTPSEPDNNPKRVLLDKSEEDNIYFTLKRQRCIRRKMSATKTKKTKSDEPLIGDDSFDSNISGKIAQDNISTPVKAETNETFTLETPVENSRRFRRCLLFESPTSLSESASTTNSSLRDVRGTMDLNIHCENDELYIHSK